MKRRFIRKVEAQSQHLPRPQRTLRFYHRFPLAEFISGRWSPRITSTEQFFTPIERENFFSLHQITRGHVQYIRFILLITWPKIRPIKLQNSPARRRERHDGIAPPSLSPDFNETRVDSCVHVSNVSE